MSSKVLLDQGLCRAYGVCVAVHPEVFSIPAGSPTAILLREIVDEDDLEDVQEAVRACPAQAITVVEE